MRSRSPAAQHEHRLQLYEDEAFLVASVATFLGGALAGGDVAVAIATAAHRARIEGKLRARAIDVTAATAQGRYVALDAETLLGTLMVASEPDARRFEESVGRVIAASAAAHPQARLHAFGEMVAILGYGRDQDRERARAAGFDHHLVKPVEPDALDALIARVASPQAKSSPATVH